MPLFCLKSICAHIVPVAHPVASMLAIIDKAPHARSKKLSIKTENIMPSSNSRNAMLLSQESEINALLGKASTHARPFPNESLKRKPLPAHHTILLLGSQSRQLWDLEPVLLEAVVEVR